MTNLARPTHLDFPLKSWWAERTDWVERALDETFPENDSMANTVEMMRYCLFSGGKRFRPILAYGAAECLGKSGRIATSAACAYEMIHCFSLAHDDLPCMDDDDMRRGKPTAHKKFNEWGALLAGDGLSIWAFHKISELPEGVSPEVGIRLVQDLALASGHRGMVGGQVIDMQAQTGTVDRAGLEAIHRAKTGALICGAVRAGALLAGADDGQLESLTNYGKAVGLVFQLTDDILDADEDPDGVSFVSLIGMEETKKLVRESTEEALRNLESFGQPADPLRALALFLEDRKG
ncbi:MAG: polyprenyl synthetase family protein [Candidatus Eremiobacteraeota bacterium]|nr:polyprenyl synthetase family protein [Candidatus Eremiobacteraeota bacterium]